MKPLISFQDITKAFGQKVILEDFNLDVDKGDFIGLIGKSGGGKTTLLRVLIGFYNINFGSIILNDQDITKNKKILKKIVGYCTQENSFYPQLTVNENLAYYGRMYNLSGRQIKHKSRELLELVKLSGNEDSLASSLSGGMKRRLDLAISLIHDPEILVLDEPTAGLDPALRESIWGLLRKINKQKKTIIIVSHFLDLMEKYCTKIAIVSNGKIKKIGSPSALKKKHKGKSLVHIFEHTTKEVVD
ncbi:ABC transporter ATP-binding protein [Nanoarchaeota archaeon]